MNIFEEINYFIKKQIINTEKFVFRKLQRLVYQVIDSLSLLKLLVEIGRR